MLTPSHQRPVRDPAVSCDPLHRYLTTWNSSSFTLLNGVSYGLLLFMLSSA